MRAKRACLRRAARSLLLFPRWALEAHVGSHQGAGQPAICAMGVGWFIKNRSLPLKLSLRPLGCNTQKFNNADPPSSFTSTPPNRALLHLN